MVLPIAPETSTARATARRARLNDFIITSYPVFAVERQILAVCRNTVAGKAKGKRQKEKR
jgi:hypothetical protein